MRADTGLDKSEISRRSAQESAARAGAYAKHARGGPGWPGQGLAVVTGMIKTDASGLFA